LAFGLGADEGEHLRLHVYGDHAPGISYHARHGQGKIARPAAQIENGHARLDQAGQEPVRVLEQPAEGVIQHARQRNRAYVCMPVSG
jgi:hypothetical protein